MVLTGMLGGGGVGDGSRAGLEGLADLGLADDEAGLVAAVESGAVASLGAVRAEGEGE